MLLLERWLMEYLQVTVWLDTFPATNGCQGTEKSNHFLLVGPKSDCLSPDQLDLSRIDLSIIFYGFTTGLELCCIVQPKNIQYTSLQVTVS